MEVAQVLRMNGGMGDTSYALNSSVQVINFCLYLWLTFIGNNSIHIINIWFYFCFLFFFKKFIL